MKESQQALKIVDILAEYLVSQIRIIDEVELFRSQSLSLSLLLLSAVQKQHLRPRLELYLTVA